MKKYRWLIVCAIGVCCIAIYCYFFCLPTTTVVLVRHAEKASISANNPSLSAAGQSRALNLASVLDQANVSLVYATQLCRTM
jgi:hypothetical protein